MRAGTQTAASQLITASSLTKLPCLHPPPPHALPPSPPTDAQTHITQMHPPVWPPVPSSMLGLVQARNHPPRQPPPAAAPLPAQFSAKRIGAPPRSLPPVDSGNGLRVLTLSFQTRFPAGLPVPARLSYSSISLLYGPSPAPPPATALTPAVPPQPGQLAAPKCVSPPLLWFPSHCPHPASRETLLLHKHRRFSSQSHVPLSLITILWN